jgi:hypothetical protein
LYRSLRRYGYRYGGKAPRPYTVFVEPEDAEAYRKAGHASIVVLPENEKGIAYARQAILDYTIQNNDKWFWMRRHSVLAGSAETIRSRLTETWTEEFYANAPSEFLHCRNFSRFLQYCIDNPEQEPLFEVERTEERKRVVKFRLKLRTFDPAP